MAAAAGALPTGSLAARAGAAALNERPGALAAAGSGAEAPAGPAAAFQLVPLQEGGLAGGETVARLFPAVTVTVGRKATCEVLIPEEFAYVSGEHCRLTAAASGEEVQLDDLSANGTFINGAKVGKGRRSTLKEGAEISLAKPTRRGGALKFRLDKVIAPVVAPVPEPAFVPPQPSLQPRPPAAASSAQNVAAALPEQGLRSTSGIASAVKSMPASRSAALAKAPGRPLHAPPSVLGPSPSAPPPRALAASGASAPAAANAAIPKAARKVEPISPDHGDRNLAMASDANLFAVTHVPAVAVPVVASAAAPAGPTAQAAPAVAEGMLGAALARERLRAEEDSARLQALCNTENARAQILAEEVQAARREAAALPPISVSTRLREERGAGSGSASAFSNANRALASECEELRQRVLQLREEGARLERACPEVQEEASRERMLCARVHAELDDERRCAEAAEAQATKLRTEAESATERVLSLREEVTLAAARNANLEAECAEAVAETARAKASASAAKQAIQSRGTQLTVLRGAVREHARRMGERLAQLEQSLQEVPAFSSPSQNSSSQPCTQDGARAAYGHGAAARAGDEAGVGDDPGAEIASASSTQSMRRRSLGGGEDVACSPPRLGAVGAGAGGAEADAGAGAASEAVSDAPTLVMYAEGERAAAVAQSRGSDDCAGGSLPPTRSSPAPAASPAAVALAAAAAKRRRTDSGLLQLPRARAASGVLEEVPEEVEADRQAISSSHTGGGGISPVAPVASAGASWRPPFLAGP